MINKIIWDKIDSFKGNSSSKILFFNRPCPVCKSIKSRSFLKSDNVQFYTDSDESPKYCSLNQCICLNCSALYLNPCYSSYGFQKLFSEAGCSYGSTVGRTDEQLKWLTERNLLKGNSLLLDIGCYEGSFLAQLPNNVKKVGLDIDKLAIERGRQNFSELGIDFINGDFENFEYRYEPPSTITMFHVLEHLPEPVKVLKKLRSISNQETCLILEVPVIDNEKTNDINGFFSVQHMTHFSIASLKNCFNLSGWEIIDESLMDYAALRVQATPSKQKNFLKIDSDQKTLDYKRLVNYMQIWYKSIEDVEDIISNLNSNYNIVVWGGGMHTECLYKYTSFFLKFSETNFTIVDIDPIKEGFSWRGIKIRNPKILNNFDWQDTYLLISSYGNTNDIYSAAISLGVPSKNIIKLYDYLTGY